MRRLFGTDGIRGRAGVEVTTDLARAVGAASVSVLAPDAPPLVVLGRDPRPSGPALAEALIDGLLAAGADVADCGVAPTAAVARAVAAGVPGADRAPAYGIVVSASHNPVSDNGIKFFGPGGTKLSPATEEALEQAVEQALTFTPTPQPHIGNRLTVNTLDWYADYLLAALPRRLDGLRVVLDCANGAAAVIAPQVYRAAGADVTVIHDDLSGERINDGCGATDLASLRREVLARGADAGIAHDGDADRCLAVDATGGVVDGDAILAILAVALQRDGRLAGDAVAATVMSNRGLELALAGRGIEVRRTDVGDRAVLDRIHADGLSLGGEQSGHIVLADHATTGDGLLTALMLLAEVVGSGRPLAELAAIVTPLPQVQLGVPVADRAAALAAAMPVADAVAAELGDRGRVLVRPSGTEPVLRIMVEAPDADGARAAAERIREAITPPPPS